MIPAPAIVKVAPASRLYAEELVRQMAESGIMANRRRASMFLGQIAAESGNFATVTESLNYSADALKRMFGRHRISLSQAEQYGRKPGQKANQEKLANILYGGEFGRKQLGNREAGDGWRFRGRGLKQLTGRDNYRRFSRSWVGDDSLLSNPDRVAQPDGAVASAVWFWVSNGLNELADTGTVEDVTRKVNGGLNGLNDRIVWTTAYADEWVDFSNVISGANTVPGVP